MTKTQHCFTEGLRGQVANQIQTFLDNLNAINQQIDSYLQKKRNHPNTTKTEQNTTVVYVVLTSNISINCNYRSYKRETNKSNIYKPVVPECLSLVIRTLSVSNKTLQNHCGSCANLISLIADMQLSRTEWAEQSGSKSSVEKKKAR